MRKFSEYVSQFKEAQIVSFRHRMAGQPEEDIPEALPADEPSNSGTGNVLKSALGKVPSKHEFGEYIPNALPATKPTHHSKPIRLLDLLSKNITYTKKITKQLDNSNFEKYKQPIISNMEMQIKDLNTLYQDLKQSEAERQERRERERVSPAFPRTPPSRLFAYPR